MASAFAGFYLALWLVLWAFILRGVSIEVGGHLHDNLWQSWWDFVFAASSLLLAVLFGAALGNVIRGVPLDGSGKFSMSLFTHFGVRGLVGILDWYTLSVAVFTTVLLSAHGATYLRLKTTGQVHERSERLARWLWMSAAVLFPRRLPGNLDRPAGTLRGDGRASGRLDGDGGCRGWSLGSVYRTARNRRGSRLRGIVCGDRGPAGRCRGRRVSGDAALDARSGALDDGLQRRRSERTDYHGAHLVAGRGRVGVDATSPSSCGTPAARCGRWQDPHVSY